MDVVFLDDPTSAFERDPDADPATLDPAPNPDPDPPSSTSFCLRLAVSTSGVRAPLTFGVHDVLSPSTSVKVCCEEDADDDDAVFEVEEEVDRPGGLGERL
jgi:hypothetical protein